jgi:hypothetical protein
MYIFPINQIGIGDYSRDGIHCDLNMSAVKVLNIIDICVATICNLLILLYIVRECHKKKSPYFLSLNAKSLFPLLFLFYGIGVVIFNIIKLISEGKNTIGYDEKITIIASLLPVFLFSGLILYFRLIIGFLNGYACMMSADSCNKVKTRFAKLSFLSFFIPPFSLVICLIQSIGLLFPNSAEEIGMLYNIATAVNSLAFGIIFNHAVGFLLRELVIHIQNAAKGSADDISAVYKRLNIAYIVLWAVFSLNGTLFLIFGSSIYLLRRSTYMVLIIQIIISPTLTVLVMTVRSLKKGGGKNDSTSRPRSISRLSFQSLNFIRRNSSFSSNSKKSKLFTITQKVCTYIHMYT